MAALIARERAGRQALLARAYTNIAVADAAAQLGLGEQEATASRRERTALRRGARIARTTRQINGAIDFCG